MESFRKLVELYEKLDNSTSHKKIIELLAEHFQNIDPAEVKITAYLALGTIGPRFEKIDLGIGDKYGIQAISQAYDVDKEKVEISFENQGDLGDVASVFNNRQRSSLTLKYVFQHFVQIRDVSGKGSQKRKINLLAEVLSQARPLESRYIMRIAQGNLRLGFGEKFLLEALALAFTGSRNNTAKVEDTYNICTDIGQLGESLAKHGMSSLGKFSIKIGRPVQMMLASRVDTMEELNEKFSATMAAEEKYDGERVQIHMDGNNIKAFSRRLTDISAQFPDVIEAVRESVKAKKIVLDGEIVAYRQEEFLPFQELMQRRRKYHIKEYVEKIPVTVFFFDVIYLDGKSLMNRSYPERRQVLEEYLVETEKVKLAGRVVSADFSRIQRFFDSCVEKGMEGIIIKSLKAKSTYRPGKRGWLWVKWKKEYIEDVRETFDLVIVGSYHGKGRRKGSFGALLCAVLNESQKRYETLAKVGTGFKDEDFAEINDLLKEYSVEKQPVNILVDSNMQPDKYIEPAVIIEVIGSEITSSPCHTSGQENSGNGYALRFPRFLRIRYDKGPEDATTVEEVKHLK